MKKRFLFIILILIGIFLNIFFIIRNINIDNSSYMILDDKNIWKIDNYSVKKVSKSIIKKINNSSAKLYSNQDINGIVSTSNIIKFYNSSFQEEKTTNSIIVVGDATIVNKTYLINTEMNNSDIQIINRYINLKSLDFNISELVIKKISLNNKNTLYSIQSLSAERIGKNGFSSIILYSNDSITSIYENFSSDYRVSTLDKVVDINNDGNEDLILLSDVHNSSGYECYSLYQFNSNSNKYEPIINCEEE